MSVYYYVPSNERPSWGAGMLYYHVWLLNKNNITAFVLHDDASFKLKWLKLDVPIVCFASLSLKENDILVLPEVSVGLRQFQKLKCKKIVFVQNAFYIFDTLKGLTEYKDLGIEEVFYYMPHLEAVLKHITSLPLYEMPPFIAPYYFSEMSSVRKRKIIVYPKFDSRDYLILLTMLKRRLNIKNRSLIKKIFSVKDEWEIIELKGKKHEEVAEEMKHAEFFVCLNTTEAFNSAVPEAMAAGCINICFEGVGPADYLTYGENAYVFPNNHIYPLVDKLVELVTDFENAETKLGIIRRNAMKTAREYTVEKLETKLVEYFQNQEKATS